VIEIGEPAPDVELPDQDGKTHRLVDYRGRPVVLYFYPKDDTSGCTTEACAFRDLLPDFDTSQAVVLGVSPDGVASHRRFADKHGLAFTLLADEAPTRGEPPATCVAYGVWQEKSMYGRKYMGVARTTYLLDADGRVAQRWDKVRVPGHARAVLDAVRALGDRDS